MLQNKNYMNEGLKAQNAIAERMAWKYNKLPNFTVMQSPEGSLTDMVDKIDITVYSKPENSIVETYDVKSTQYSDKITYTYINSLGERSKIYNKDFSTDLIFTFDTYNTGYFVKAENFYNSLNEKINSGKTFNGKAKPNSKYVWFTKDEIVNMAYDII